MQVATTTGGRSPSPAEDLQWAIRHLEIVEPRCHICRNPAVRRAVNDLLDWHGAPLPGGGRIGYRDILTVVRRKGFGRSPGARITYASFWNHAKRHYDHEVMTAYWTRRMDTELYEALTRLASLRQEFTRSHPDRS